MTIDPLFTPQQDLLVGFFSPTTVGSGFTSLTLAISANGQLLTPSKTFTTTAAANAYLTDDPIDLGSIVSHEATDGLVHLQIALTETVAKAASGYYANVVVGDPTPPPAPPPLHVPNATDALIVQLYYGLLDRAPDAGGLAAFEASGTPLRTVARDLIQSSDYAHLHGPQSNSQFVEALFEGAFGRSEGANGAEGWLAPSGPRKLPRGHRCRYRP